MAAMDCCRVSSGFHMGAATTRVFVFLPLAALLVTSLVPSGVIEVHASSAKLLLLRQLFQHHGMHGVGITGSSEPRAFRRQLGSGGGGGRAPGYGSGATGGEGGKVVTVTNMGDSGRGTLREACAQSGKVIIRFKSSGTISLKSPVECLSDHTIDGSGVQVTIVGHGLSFIRQSNVVIKGLCLKNSRMDGITLRRTSNVWIDRVTVVETRDGAIDIIDASTGITVSNSKFVRQTKVMLVGNQNGKAEDKNIRLSVVGCYFKSCGSRMPRVRYGTAHVCSNVFEDWAQYVMGGSMGAKILCENNAFIKGRDTLVDHFHNDPRDGTKIVFLGSVLLRGAVTVSKHSGRLGIPYSCSPKSYRSVMSSAGAGNWCA